MNKKEIDFKYQERGKGPAIVVLYGLMGGLSNFQGVLEYFPKKGFRIIVPELPTYSLPLSKTTVKSLADFLNDFITFKGLKDIILLGNSLGGHIALLYSKFYPENVKGIVITGSSGLYENSMGDGYPKRGNYEYIKAKTEEVFYDPKVATKKLVDDVFKSVNDRSKVVRTLAIAKSAIRHNMSRDLPKMKIPTAIIWGSQDTVTPPNVATEFNSLIPKSDLYWIDHCGHAPMMEHPEKFNEIVHSWIKKNKF